MLFSPKRTHDDTIGPPSVTAKGADLKSTLVSPHLEATIEPGKNVLWCSTFQLVWNEGCRQAGGDIRLKDEPAIVASLNKKVGDKKDVDAAGCLAMAGLAEKGIVGKIRWEFNQKFQDQANPALLDIIETKLPREGWLAYAYLFRSLPFEHAFQRLPEPLAFGSAKVASFGLRNIKHSDDQIAEQAAVLDYASDDDFIVALQPKDKSERILLAKIAPAETLEKTIETVHARAASSKIDAAGRQLESDESIAVPILNFELQQTYEELRGKKITTAGPLKGMPIILAVQSIRFRLDENGATLKSEAAMVGAKSMAPKKLRQFIFDKPFLILLERKDAALPYFAMWVDNPELLTPFKSISSDRAELRRQRR